MAVSVRLMRNSILSLPLKQKGVVMRLISASTPILALVLIGLVLFGCSGDPETKKVAHYKKAMVYLEEKNPSAATIELRNAIQLDPKYAQARYQLGLLYLQAGEAKNAFNELQRAASLDPANLDA